MNTKNKRSVTPVFTKTIASEDCQYEDDIDKLAGWFYRSSSSSSSSSGSSSSGGGDSSSNQEIKEMLEAIDDKIDNIQTKVEENACSCNPDAMNIEDLVVVED